MRISVLPGFLDGGAAGIGKSEKIGGLVEGLARGVVAGFAEESVAQRARGPIEAGVAAGDRMGWVRRVWECARPALFAPSPGLRRQRFFPARARPFQPSGRPLTAVLRRLGAETVAV